MYKLVYVLPFVNFIVPYILVTKFIAVQMMANYIQYY